MKLFLNACPRCLGTLIKDSDRYGGYLECLQCGWYRDHDALYLKDGGERRPEGRHLLGSLQPWEKRQLSRQSPR